jgi:hypothetical protein
VLRVPWGVKRRTSKSSRLKASRMAICRTLRPTWPYLLKGLRAGQSHSEWPAMPINSFARELCEASSYQSSYHLAA